MTLRQKILATTVLVFFALAFIMLLISLYILQSGFRGIEKQSIHLDVERALSFIDSQISELSANALDYSGWDDTYDFAQNHNAAYIRSNFTQATLTIQKLNLLMILDQSGNRIYETGFDQKSFLFTPVPRMLRDASYLQRLLASARRNRGELNGVILLDDGPMMISIQPILKSNLSGPSRGSLIMGKSLNAEGVARLSQLTHQNLQFYGFYDGKLTPELQQVRHQLFKSKSVIIQPLSGDTVSGYGRIDDIFGQPSLILCTTEPRTIYEQGVLTIKYMFVFLLICATVFMAISLFLFEWMVMKRLSRMNEDAIEIGNSDNTGHRFQVSGKDELSLLAKSMNIMMEKIEQTKSLLRAEAARYRAVVEDQTELICRYLPDGTLIFVNDAYCRYYGKKQSDLLGSKAPVTISEEDREYVERCRQALNKENTNINYEYRVSLSDGSIRWQHATERMLPDEIGQPLEFQLVIRDITKRKKIEESLKDAYVGLEQRIQERTLELQIKNEELSAEIERRKHTENALLTSEKKYEGIVSNIGCGIIMLDQDMNIIAVNRQMKQWFPDLRLSGSILYRTGECKSGEQEGFLYPAVETLRDGQIHETESQLCIGEESRLFRIVSSAIKGSNGSVEAVIEMLDDVTERHKAEEILRISESRYRGIVEDQTEFVCRMTLDGRLTFVNDAYRTYLSKDFNEMIGNEFLSFVYYEDRQKILDMVASLSPANPVISFECRVLMENGEIRWQQWTNRAIYSIDNSLSEHQAVGRDITERKKTEEALWERQEELDEKSRSLEEVNTTLRVLLKQKDKDREEIEAKILSNINELVMPYIDKLKTAPLDARNKTCLEILETNLRDIRSEFTGHLPSGGYNLTSKELDVANLIREGKTTKEIADLLYLSKNTVDFHRNNIRKKLGISNEKTNLRAYLVSLS
jgi:PAS domain S-box-containing protein